MTCSSVDMISVMTSITNTDDLSVLIALSEVMCDRTIKRKYLKIKYIRSRPKTDFLTHCSFLDGASVTRVSFVRTESNGFD